MFEQPRMLYPSLEIKETGKSNYRIESTFRRIKKIASPSIDFSVAKVQVPRAPLVTNSQKEVGSLNNIKLQPQTKRPQIILKKLQPIPKGAKNNQSCSRKIQDDDIEDLIVTGDKYTYETEAFPKNTDIHALNSNELHEYVTSQMIGRNLFIKGSFGDKLKLYLDYAASGQGLKFIQDELTKIEEMYANPHMDASQSGVHMHYLLNQAENIILKECQASPEDYCLITGGGGSTYAIEMVQRICGTYLPPKVKEQLEKLADSGSNQNYTFEGIKNKLREKGILPIVMISLYEHHSNEITWRKQLCDIIQVPFRLDGLIDVDAFENILQKNQHTKRPIICSFSAGSNVTGMKTDVFAMAKLCKQFNAVSLFDYAGVGTYVPLDLSQRDEKGNLLIDGIYLSPHKFLGGPGACGLLILNKAIMDKEKLSSDGSQGGALSKHHSFEYGDRERLGTPGIMQVIKAALAFELKGLMQDFIHRKEPEYNKVFFEKLCSNKNFMNLGTIDEDSKVSIMSFNIWMNGPKGKRLLHHHLVIRLLSDVFGIQGRSGCSCAATYGHILFNIDQEHSMKHRFFVQAQRHMENNYQIQCFKPGWGRITLHYVLKAYELDYIFFALNYLCEYGSRFLPLYILDPLSGTWNHKSEKWDVPHLNLGELLNQDRKYARDEEARKIIFEKQKKDAMKLLDMLPVSKGYDTIDEAGELCRFYVEKGNVLNRNILEEKCALFKKNFKSEK